MLAAAIEGQAVFDPNILGASYGFAEWRVHVPQWDFVALPALALCGALHASDVVQIAIRVRPGAYDAALKAGMPLLHTLVCSDAAWSDTNLALVDGAGTAFVASVAANWDAAGPASWVVYQTPAYYLHRALMFVVVLTRLLGYDGTVEEVGAVLTGAIFPPGTDILTALMASVPAAASQPEHTAHAYLAAARRMAKTLEGDATAYSGALLACAVFHSNPALRVGRPNGLTRVNLPVTTIPPLGTAPGKP